MMMRRVLLPPCALAAIILGLSRGAPAEQNAARPNVLLILTDDQGYGDLGLHGNPHLRTPNLDALGKSGVRFERFYVNSFCAPTRAALVTGRYPLRCGVWGVTHNKEAMRPSEVTLAEALRGAGYRTACIGKWHNGEQYPYTPPGQGFDEFLGFCNGHTNNYFDAALTRGSQQVETRGFISDVLTDDAIRFIRETKDQPFFCYLSFNAPHSPHQAPDRHYEKFRKQGFDEAVSAFYAMCENIDKNIGRLLATLEEAGRDENTIVLFLTDNGGTAGVKIYNARMRGGKTSVHEGGCRVPLFLRWPARWREPRVIEQIASHIDLYPTLLELCGVEKPDGPPLDGVSLVPLLDGAGADWPERVLFTHNPISRNNGYPGAVRTQRWRLVRTIRGPQGGSSAKPNDDDASPWRLYDMAADPGETQDLSRERPEVVGRLSRLYEAWLDDTAKQGLERFPLPVGHDEENPVTLNAPQAYFEGSLQFDHGPGYAHDWLTDWSDRDSKVWFDLDVVRGGDYELTLRYACPEAPGRAKLRIDAGDEALEVAVPAAAAPAIPLPHRDDRSRRRYVHRDWAELPLGRLPLSPGRRRITIELAPGPELPDLEIKGLTLSRM
ncbi:MAG: arylsulfatase [Planctomycetes bacterium]|nr:arylsulfatase [Planctomycetota bacterium]